MSSADKHSNPGSGGDASPDPVYPDPKHLNPAVASSLRRYWRSNIKLMCCLLLVWLFAGLGCGVLFADKLNAFHLGGYPLGFWFAQQGAIITFVFLILIYAILMNRLDAKHLHELQVLKKTSGGDGQ